MARRELTRKPGRRVADWRARLDAMLDDACRARFVWGRHDCVLFAGLVTEAVLGYDLAAPWRGAYDGPVAALRLIRRAGHRDLAAAVTAAVGPPARRLRRGDLVLLPVAPAAGPLPGLPSWSAGLGVLLGQWCAMPRQPAGLRLVVRDDILQAWAL